MSSHNLGIESLLKLVKRLVNPLLERQYYWVIVKPKETDDLAKLFSKIEFLLRSKLGESSLDNISHFLEKLRSMLLDGKLSSDEETEVKISIAADNSSSTFQPLKEVLEEAFKKYFPDAAETDIAEVLYGQNGVYELVHLWCLTVIRHEESVKSNLAQKKEELLCELTRRRDESKDKRKDEGQGKQPVNEETLSVLSEVTSNIFEHLVYSLLTGEYIRDDNYSKILGDIRLAICNKLDEDEKDKVYYIHPTLVYLSRLCDEMIKMCQVFRVQLGLEGYEHVQRVFVVKEYDYIRLRTYVGGSSCPEEREARVFYELGMKLIEMTKIDMAYSMDERRFGVLTSLYSSCSYWLKSPAHLDIPGFIRELPKRTGASSILEMIKVKSAVLLTQWVESLSSDKSDKKESIFISQGEIYLSNSSGAGSKPVSSLSFVKCCRDSGKDRCQPVSKVPWTLSGKHVVDYNQYVENDLSLREKVEKVKGFDCSKMDHRASLRTELGAVCQGDHCIPPEYALALLNKIDELYDLAEKGEETSTIPLQYLAVYVRDLINRAQRGIELLGQGVGYQAQKRKKFESSFYAIGENGTPIFISSYEVNALALNEVTSDVLPKYRALHSQLLAKQAEDLSVKLETKTDELSRIEAKTAKLSVQLEAQKQDFTTNLEAQKRELSVQLEVQKQNFATGFKTQMQYLTDNFKTQKQYLTDDFENIKREVNQVASDTRKESMTLLSIFAAVMAFLVGGTAVFRDTDQSLADYLIVFGSMVLLAGLLLKVLYLKKFEWEYVQVDMGRLKKVGRGVRYWENFFLTIAMLFAIILVIGGWCLREAERGKAKTEQVFQADSLHTEREILLLREAKSVK